MNTKKKTGKANGREEGELLLPWHVTGRLEAQERESVDAWLETRPDAEFHLGLIREERDVTVAENEALEGAPAGALARLHQRIEEEDGAAVRRAAKPSLMDSLSNFFSFETPALRYAGIAAALLIIVQAAAIGALMTSSDRIGPFRTASHPEKTLAGEETRLLLGFEDAVSAAKITGFLQEIDGEIVSGPTPDGIYTVRVADKLLARKELEALIRKLEARKGVVRFVAETE